MGYFACQYPVLLEPTRVIRPFLFRASNTRERVRWDFPVFRISSAYVRRGSSRRRVSTVCSRELMWSFILPSFWPDNGNLFLSSLEKAMEFSLNRRDHIYRGCTILRQEADKLCFGKINVFAPVHMLHHHSNPVADHISQSPWEFPHRYKLFVYTPFHPLLWDWMLAWSPHR